MTTQQAASAKPTVLKKYPNRRIYDPSKNAHVTLSEIADRVRNGEQVKIVDHKTGDDLTQIIMGQVLFETLKTRPDYLPLDLVVLMIRAQDNLVKGFLTNGLPAAFQMYMEQQRRMMSGIGWLGQGYPNMPNMVNPFSTFFPGGPQQGYSYGAGQPQAGPAPEPVPDPLKKEVDQLRAEIEKMKTGGEKPKPRGRKKKG